MEEKKYKRYIKIPEVEYRRLRRREKLLLRLRSLIKDHWQMVAPIVKNEKK